MADLAGVGRISDFGHRWTREEHGEKEEIKANSPRWNTRVRSNGGRRMAMAVAVMVVALGLGVAWRLGETAVAPKLKMGAARCGHLVFIARSGLRHQARESGVDSRRR